MRQTIRDTYNSLTRKNIAAAIIGVSSFFVILWIFGFEIAKRFVHPLLIGSVAVIGWKISRIINQDGLSRILHAGSVGMMGFALALTFAAIIDGNYFASQGYASWTVAILMWMWITYHLVRALKILLRMKPDQLQHITQGTAIIVAQMEAEARKSAQVLDRYRTVKNDLKQLGMI